jgi:hypothetical protein
MKNKFGYIMLTLALLVAGCAGYFSVWGLSQLFAGASTAVIIMATALEIGKIVTTTALHRYWKKISGLLKIYLTISVVVLMLITSAGIYGFLSNAYQKTANKLEIHEGEISVFEGKKTLFQNNIDDNEKIIDQKNKRVDQLSELRNTQETRLDAATNNRNRSGARTDIQNSNTEIQKLSDEVDGLNQKNSALNDSINKYNTMVLELKAGSEVAAEVGPLKYISELTGTPMAKVVNFLILLLIFVFDPLAVALVLMTNRIFEIEEDKDETVNEPKEPKPTSITQVIEQKEIDDIVEEPIMMDEQHDDNEAEEIKPEEVVEAPEVIIETPQVESVEEEPINHEDDLSNNDSNKIRLEDIKEIKNRGFSVNVPQPKTNSNVVERIGSNKFLKNNDNNTVYYKRNK